MAKANADTTATTPKKRGKPNPHETQINEVIARFEAKNEEPLDVLFKSAADAKKGYRNLWASLRNRGYKASIAVEGTTLKVRVVGAAKKGGKRRGPKAAKAAPSAARPRARQRKAPIATGTNGGAANFLVRVRQGRGWSYRDFASKGAAAAERDSGRPTCCEPPQGH